MRSNCNRVMIVSSGSDCGKTTITCGLLKALKNRKKEVLSFKCGPDYIDPMFHSHIVGIPGRNLDIFLLGENTCKYLLAEDAKGMDIAVIEGAMGMYDGKDFEHDDCSANHISGITNTPEILLVNARGKSLSLVAEISGFLTFKKNNLKGVILNRCSEGMYPIYKKMIEDKLDLKVCGYFPYDEDVVLESRHLGLVTANEISNLDEKIEHMGKVAEKTLEIDTILELSMDTEPFTYDSIPVETSKDKVRVALARDNAFSFYYEDNLRLFRQMGLELVEFSPIKDKKLPENISGLILGGGYPEEYGRELEDNVEMREAVKRAVEAGLPTYAECGGFMYLGETITRGDDIYKMVGALKTNSVMTKGLVRFGYKDLVANEDNLLCSKGDCIRCHEFHHSEIDDYGDSFTSIKGEKFLPCVIGSETLYAGYPHLHLWGNIDFARNFVKKCKEFKGEAD